MSKIIIKYGKKYFLDGSYNYMNFKKRLDLLKKVHPKLKYTYNINKNKFYLYVRRWGN